MVSLDGPRAGCRQRAGRALRLGLTLTALAAGAWAPASAATVAWSAQFDSGPVDAYAEVRAIAVGDNGNVYAAGWIANGTATDFLTVAWDAGGNLLWYRLEDGPHGGRDEAVAIAVGPGGNVYVTGWAAWGSYEDFLTVAYDGSGQELWARTQSSVPDLGHDRPFALAVDSQNRVFVTGEASSGGTGTERLYTVAYDAQGNGLWSRQKLDAGASSGRAIGVDGSGRVLIAAQSKWGGDFDYLMVAYGSSGGEELWSRIKDGAGGDDRPQAMTVDAAGRAIVTGHSNTGTDEDILTVAFAGSGVELWSHNWGSGPGADDLAWSIATDPLGNIYVAGYSTSSPITSVRLVSYDALGVERWTASRPGPGGTDSAGFAVATDAVGRVFVTGSAVVGSNYDALTVAFDGASGAEIWARTNGAPEASEIGWVVATSAGGAVYTGAMFGAFPGSDLAVLAFDAEDGDERWTRSEPPIPATDVPGDRIGTYGNRAIAVGANGNVYLTGFSRGDDSQDYLTVAYGAAGELLWTSRKEGVPGLRTTAVAIAVDDASGNVYVTGRLQSGGGTGYDYLTVAYDAAGTELWARQKDVAGGTELACCVAVAPNGNVVVTGWTYGWENPDYLTVAYDSAGNELWTTTSTAALGSVDQASAMGVSASGRTYVTGRTDQGYWTVALDPDGNELWDVLTPAAGSPVDLATGPGESVVISGSVDNGADSDFLTVAYDSSGFERWQITHAGGNGAEDFARAVAVAPTGRVFVAGTSGGDFLTLAYDDAGTELWARLDGSGHTAEEAQAMALGATTVYTVGSSGAQAPRNFLVYAYGLDGEPLFELNHDNGGDDDAYLAAAAPGGVVIAGVTRTLENDDFLTVRLFVAEPIFLDGFESGDASAWSAVVP